MTVAFGEAAFTTQFPPERADPVFGMLGLSELRLNPTGLPMTQKDWCCLAFKANYSAEASRGLVVAALGTRLPTGFYLIARSVDGNRVAELSARLAVPISLAERVQIRACPWCGVDLMRYYGGRSDLPLAVWSEPTGPLVPPQK